MNTVNLLLDHYFPYGETAYNTAGIRTRRVTLHPRLPRRWALALHFLDIYRKSDQVDIILGNRRTTLLLGLLFRMYKPRRVSLVGYEMVFTFRRNTVRTQLALALWKIAIARVDKLIIQSEEEQAYLAKTLSASPQLFHPIPFLSDKTAFIGPSPAGYLFSAGRMERDFVTLLEALRHTNIPAVIVAEETQRERLAPLASPNVRLFFDVPKTQYLSWLQAARLVVVSLNDGPVARGQVVLLEAMRYGKPVVYTRTTGAEEYVDHGTTGWLVPPHSPHELRQLLLTIFPDTAALSEVGRRAYDRQRRCFSPEVFYQNYHRMIREVHSHRLGIASLPLLAPVAKPVASNTTTGG